VTANAAGAAKRAPAGGVGAAIVAALAIVASIRGVFNDFVYDDIPIIQDNARIHQFDFAHVREIFSHAYWPPPFVEQLYRPLTLAGLAAQHAVGGGSPMVFRLVSYALYAATAVLGYRLASRMLDPWPSLGVAALFAVHPVHVEAVALGVNQAELVVSLIALVMTTSYIDWRRAGAIRGRQWALLAVLYAVATLVKESGFVLPLFLVAADVTILRVKASPPPSRADALGYASLAAVAAASLALRFAVAGAPAFAVVPAAELRGLSVVGRLGVMLHVVPMWLRLLVWPRHLQVDFAPGEIESGGAIEAVFGLLILCGLAAAIVSALRRDRVLAFGLLWMTIALVPVSNILPTGVILGERTLFLPSIGFVIAAGAIAQRALATPAMAARWRRLALAEVCALLVVLGLLRSAGRQAVWNTQHVRMNPPTSGAS
jgi:protein O-mannosyl-transferase